VAPNFPFMGKVTMKTLWLTTLALATCFLHGTAEGAVTKDRAITKVVKMLEAMLEKSKADGDADRKTYAKFLCYCNTNKEEKTSEIESLSKDIEALETKIEELKASTGVLSKEVAKLDADMADNELSQKKATKLRMKEEEAFLALEEDLTEAIGQMGKAIETLAEVGADQTLANAAADHKQFMAGKKGLLALHSRVKEALTAAASFLQGDHHKEVFKSFLQAPFTGTYTAQSGEVVGILKDMRDTFKANLASATILEAKQSKAYVAFMASQKEAFQKMKEMFELKQKKLGENDSGLAAKKEKLAEAQKQKGVCEDFLSEMVPLCDAKTAEYNERNMLRASEDAAISEALAILNKDSSFNAFGKVEATSKEVEFVQMAAITVHSPAGGAVRSSALHLLQAAGPSLRLAKVMSLLEGENPFAVVLKEIEKMLDVIGEEGKLDKEKLDWCNSERKETKAKIEKKEGEILELEAKIDELTSEIEKPETGLLAMIDTAETELEQNVEDQKSETELRTEDNLVYQATIADLVDAEGLLSAAIKVLTKYYDSLEKYDQEEAEEVKKLPGEDEARPETWEDEKGYKGQSGKGTKVIETLQFILENTEKEEKSAHADEMNAQHEFEDSMTKLKDEEKELGESLVKLKTQLAEKTAELLESKKTLKETIAVKEAAEAYLLEIKPGCDFITENFDKREEHREAETKALKKAADLLKGTPAYKAAESEAELESLGSCKDICVDEGRGHAKCKACLADVTVPGYCAGHPDTDGC